ncbi:ABC transporter permease [Rhodospirillum centenum]|uniref:ABC-2 type transporter transmembrane domain-containing protein n=1 Tax=Rhodospirillum centenum (strain ATCC 51521 / SW) TaxID=414684 RepID=B6INM5_RHOCS|nr:ABC transporter permease [Rhodospirillum centenum]ACI99209.1 hypothetical protein RC1_1813 [Rhodospirillum centenum SW]
MMHTLLLFPRFVLTFLRSLLRDRKVRNGLISTPLVALAFIVFYKATVFRDISFAQKLVGSSYTVLVADTGEALPGLGLTAAEAAERIGRFGGMAVRTAPLAEAEAALAAEDADLLVLPAPDGQAVLVRSPLRLIDQADLVRDLLLHGDAIGGDATGTPAAAGPPPGARYDVRVVEVPQDTKSGILRFAAFYLAIGIAAFCFTTGAVAFVVETRKGQLRFFSVSPVSRGLVMVSHATAVGILAVAQSMLLLVSLVLTGEGANINPLLALAAAIGAAAMLTAIGYAALSFKPVDDEKGATPLLIILIMLASVHFGYAAGKSADPTDGPDLFTLFNPLGPLTELFDMALSGRVGVQPLEWSLAAVAAWTLAGFAVAWFRLRFVLEPDWSRR